jgi:hypothetical protein
MSKDFLFLKIVCFEIRHELVDDDLSIVLVFKKCTSEMSIDEIFSTFPGR